MKTLKISIHFIFPSLFLLSVGCTLPKLEKEAPEINEIAKSSAFRINLPENHSTGYLWQLNQNFDQAILESSNSVWHGNEKGIDFNFKPLAAGQTTINIVLRRYNDTSDVKSFIVKILDN